MSAPQNLKDILKRDEGVRTTSYLDTEGVWTIGVGHTGPEVKKGLTWTMDQVNTALDKDILVARRALDTHLPWWTHLNEPRQWVMISMVFNLGIAGFLKFKDTLASIQAGRWSEAKKNMLNSKWATQVGARATRLANMMETGVVVA